MSQRKPVVLIAEDDPSSAEMLQLLLRMQGWTTRTAGNAPELLAAIDGGGCDAVLMDLSMPGLSTEGLVREVAARPHRPPVVVYSARLEGEIQEAAAQLRPSEGLQKPVAIDAIVAALGRALRLPGAA